MNISEASAVNVLLDGLLGEGRSTDEVTSALATLAERANAALAAGWSGGRVVARKERIEQLNGEPYVTRDDRFVVSLIVGYGEEVSDVNDAAVHALELTRDGGQDGTLWRVFDRESGQTVLLEQADFEELEVR